MVDRPWWWLEGYQGHDGTGEENRIRPPVPFRSTAAANTLSPIGGTG